jgi:hypothetical protein
VQGSAYTVKETEKKSAATKEMNTDKAAVKATKPGDSSAKSGPAKN